MCDKITQNYMVVSPAYGRDYKNKAAATKDFLDGKDFILESFMVRPSGTYCSIRDFASGVKVEVRYARLTKLTIVTVPQ